MSVKTDMEGALSADRLASRSETTPAFVRRLVELGIVSASCAEAGLAFAAIGTVALKGVAEAVPLYLASRSAEGTANWTMGVEPSNPTR